MWKSHVIILISYCSVIKSQFTECYDDIGFEPELGLLSKTKFNFLGALQYIHVKSGKPHYFRVPRVVLVSRQFVLSIAIDAAEVPHGYALGNIAFGDYERDETECGLSLQDIAQGQGCSSALLIIPIADVLLHPEYKNFDVKNSVALLKLITPVKSRYTLPVCLPTFNMLEGGTRQHTFQRFLHVDFLAAAPRDFAEEEKEVTSISIFSAEVCQKYGSVQKNNTTVNRRMVCTTGCDYHSGAPTVVHEQTGHWSLVSLATDGSPCPDPLRSNKKFSLPYHITIYPYVPWISMAITGIRAYANSKNDPFGYKMTSGTYVRRRGKYSSWVGHWWIGGLRCYDRGLAAFDLFRFYHDTFIMEPRQETFVNYYVEVTARPTVSIVCVKVCLPHRYGDPTVFDLNTAHIKISIPLINVKKKYTFTIEAWAHTVPNDTNVEDKEELDLL